MAGSEGKDESGGSAKTTTRAGGDEGDNTANETASTDARTDRKARGGTASSRLQDDWGGVRDAA